MNITPIIKMALLDARSHLRLIREIRALTNDDVSVNRDMVIDLLKELDNMVEEIGTL